MAQRPDPALLAGLRAVTVTGEPFHGRQAEALRALLGPDCVVHNRYGSSETGLICDHPVPAGDGAAARAAAGGYRRPPACG